MLQGILLPAVHDGESFSFSMCNPPFFETLQEAGRNPHTAYAGEVFSPLSVDYTLHRCVTSVLTSATFTLHMQVTFALLCL